MRTSPSNPTPDNIEHSKAERFLSQIEDACYALQSQYELALSHSQYDDGRRKKALNLLLNFQYQFFLIKQNILKEKEINKKFFIEEIKNVISMLQEIKTSADTNQITIQAIEAKFIPKWAVFCNDQAKDQNKDQDKDNSPLKEEEEEGKEEAEEERVDPTLLFPSFFIKPTSNIKALVDEAANTIQNKNTDKLHDIKVQITAFKTEINASPNYFTYKAILKKHIERYQQQTSGIDENARKKIISYLNIFNSTFITLLKVPRIDSKQTEHQLLESTTNSEELIPLGFQEIQMQEFHKSIQDVINLHLKKLKSTILFSLFHKHKIERSKEIGFMTKLSHELSDVELFIQSPTHYLRLCATISDYLNDAEHADPETRNWLQRIQSHINQKIFHEKKTYTSTVSELINLDQIAYAEWEYSKVYIRELHQSLEQATRSNLFKSIAGRIFWRDFSSRKEVSRQFIIDFQKDIHKHLIKNGNPDHPEKLAFEYLYLLSQKIKELQSGNYIDKDAIITKIKTNAYHYLKFLNNQKGIRLHNQKRAAIYIAFKNIFSSKDKMPFEELLSLQHGDENLSEMITSQESILSEKHKNNLHVYIEEHLNSYPRGYNSELPSSNNNNVSLDGSIETTEDVSEDIKKISENPHTRKIFSLLSVKLRGYFLSALCTQSDLLKKEDADIAKSIHSIFTPLSQAIALTPYAGTILKPAVSALGNEMAQQANQQHEQDTKKNALSVNQINQIDAFSDYIARKLTLTLENQIDLITEESYGKLAKVIVERVSTAIAKNSNKCTDLSSLAQNIIGAVLSSTDAHGYLKVFTTWLPGKDGKTNYTAEELISSCGLAYKNADDSVTYYAPHGSNDHTIYGFRQATSQDIPHLDKYQKIENGNINPNQIKLVELKKPFGLSISLEAKNAQLEQEVKNLTSKTDHLQVEVATLKQQMQKQQSAFEERLKNFEERFKQLEEPTNRQTREQSFLHNR